MKKNIVLSILLIHISFYVSDLFPQEEIKIENNVKLEYTQTESRDVPKLGDEKGSRIILYFDGRIEKYSIVYGSGEILLAVRKLNQNEFNFIDRIFSEYNFLEYPDKIPMIKTPMWPSSSTGVKYKACQECELKAFSTSSNSDRRNIPSNYYEFIHELKARLYSYF
jgi:hypothetical protein